MHSIILRSNSRVVFLHFKFSKQIMYGEMAYSTKERIFLLNEYTQKRNTRHVQCAWKAQFNTRSAPTRGAILYNHAKFNLTGSVKYTPLQRPGTSEKRQLAIILLKSMVKENPCLSIRKMSCGAGISFSMAQDILKRDLKLKPYKYQECQLLEAPDYAKRVIFARMIISLPASHL